ncbi:MAG: branched-chain amino acid transport system permease protein [Acidobacteriota bacterium]|jgi:branched-chain amino acid transport system permease protein|nr:branched-chain amino acid transport system permease protein [Acidobacteriota bacterium]
MDTFVQQLINGLTIGSIYALIALGYTMVYGILRLINFAHGDIYMLGAYSGYFIAHWLGFANEPSVVGLAVTLVGSMAAAALIGMAIERFAYRPVRKYARMTTLITAIGVSLLLENLGVVIFGGTPRSFPELLQNETYRLFGNAAISKTQLLIFGVSLVLMIVLQFIVYRTKVGTAMRAVSFNLNSAKLMGINTDAIIVFTFALGSALAAAGGVLTAQYNPTIYPLMGIITGLKAFVAAVLGGIGNIPGAVMGGLLIGAAETFVVGYGQLIGIPSTYRDAVAFAILILVLLFRPAGLLGTTVQEKV